MFESRFLIPFVEVFQFFEESGHAGLNLSTPRSHRLEHVLPGITGGYPSLGSLRDVLEGIDVQTAQFLQFHPGPRSARRSPVPVNSCGGGHAGSQTTQPGCGGCRRPKVASVSLAT
ncbi:hypothetical protein BaRGS_00011408 [Batillaria attramentaria]|uniref:Uncharacterized protein n=1 Tax=Batillaria attramentaria TaxID=370345 RepID=A0ABD0LEB1_9CAEN